MALKIGLNLKNFFTYNCFYEPEIAAVLFGLVYLLSYLSSWILVYISRCIS